MLQYVGDSIKLRNRIRQHCTGNVEGSTLRKTIAENMGFEIQRTKRETGTTKKSVTPAQKLSIDEYVQSGKWRWMPCPVQLYHEFQNYLISELKPPLNKELGDPPLPLDWDEGWNDEFKQHMRIILSPDVSQYEVIFVDLGRIENVPGVYLFFHEKPLVTENSDSSNDEESETVMRDCTACSDRMADQDCDDCGLWHCFVCLELESCCPQPQEFTNDDNEGGPFSWGNYG